MTVLAKRQPLVAIIGPTASGKSALAIRLAKVFNGEIVSADSRQFYRGMEIGSDTVMGVSKVKGGLKTIVADGVPHHLVSMRSPKNPVTIAEFSVLAKRRIRSILKRGKLPFLVGGSGLYISALIDNYKVPPSGKDLSLRKKLERKSTDVIFAMLWKQDPDYAKRIAKNNRRHAIRALEVMAITGKTFSTLQHKGEPCYDVIQIGISRPREEMYARIDARVDVLMKKGLLKEARRCGKRYGWGLPTMSGLGHRQLGMFLRGEITEEAAVNLIKRDTRRFAKRQMTWFRRDKRILWVKGYGEAKRAIVCFLKAKETP